MEATKFDRSRMVVLRELMGFSQKDFAEKIGITQGALSQIESGKSNASFDTIKKISDEFNVNCNWLIRGIGDVSLDLSEVKKSTSKTLKQSFDMKSKALIPLIREEAQAGYIDGHGDQEYLKTLDIYQIPGFEEGNYRLFEVVGDSMIPTINPREIVVCEFVVSPDKIENASLCVLITKEGIVAKRVYYQDVDPGKIILKSDNPSYTTYSVDREIVKEIWQIKAKITSVFSDSSLDNRRLEKLESDINLLRNQISKLKDNKNS